MTDAPSETRRPGRARRSGRRGGDSGTRDAILAAARTRFGDLGYDRTTIRGIAADAGVDAALVHHFYGSKEQLFAAAMRLPVNPREVLDAALAPGARGQDQTLGEHLLRTVLGVWEVAEIRATFLGLLRSAPTSEQAVIMLREFLAGAIIGPLAAAARQAAPDVAAAGRRVPRGARRQPGAWPGHDQVRAGTAAADAGQFRRPGRRDRAQPGPVPVR